MYLSFQNEANKCQEYGDVRIQDFTPDYGELAWTTFGHLARHGCHNHDEIEVSAETASASNLKKTDKVYRGCGMEHGIPRPNKPDEMESYFRMLMKWYSIADTEDNVFANPSYLVSAKAPSERFIQEARKAQKSWFKQFKSILYQSRRAKREAGKMSPINRQLCHTGVLIVEGRHLFPNQWPDKQHSQRSPTSKKGERREHAPCCR